MENTVKTPAGVEPGAYVRDMVSRSGTSFFWAMRTLPPEKRDAMFAIYAFCREVDDIADGPASEDDKRRRLGQWRTEIENLYAGAPRHPVGQAIKGPVRRFGLKKDNFLAVIAGMEMDAGDKVRIHDLDELGLYCDRVACAVGRLSNKVFGLDEETGDQLAFTLGTALQLTNILRDVAEDAERDRLYLPEDMLMIFDIDDTSDINAVLADSELPGVCELMAEIVVRRFRETEDILARCDSATVRPAAMMKDVYKHTFKKLQQRGWQKFDRPVHMSKPEKLWLALRHTLGWT